MARAVHTYWYHVSTWLRSAQPGESDLVRAGAINHSWPRTILCMKTDKELQQENLMLYRVAREGATEPPGSSEYLHVEDDGMFHCAVCNALLFSTDTKFDSGSGWPSFTDPVRESAVTLHEDSSHGMTRTEVRCATCDAHLGHVFPDGPKQADGKVCDRYCINGVSLALQEKTD